MLAWIFLIACMSPEQGIDDSRVGGRVRIEPIVGDEGDEGDNDALEGATALPDLGPGLVRLEGRFVAQPNPRQPDHDWLQFTSRFEHTRTFKVTAPAGASLALYELVEAGDGGEGEPPELVPVGAVEGEGEVSLEATLREGVTYALDVAGVPGDFSATWSLVAEGPDPSALGVKVGAWLGPDFASRGAPVGGAEVLDFALGEDGAWEGSFEILLLRSVAPSSEGAGMVVDEALAEVHLYAGTFPSLNVAPAGTFYSSTGLTVAAGQVVEDVGVLVLDAQLVLLPGWDLLEEEPNDVAVNDAFELDLDALDDAQALPPLSGIGTLDVLRGATSFGSDPNALHDPDVFAFTVPQPMRLGLTLRWEDPDTDIDLIVYDGAGEVLDYAASTDNPELGGGEAVYEPDVTYYLTILGYTGPADTEVPWTLRVEQNVP
jgi:hypothetical protein